MFSGFSKPNLIGQFVLLFHWTGVLSILLLIAASNTAAADETVDFQKQILPLLSDRCFACHGPDKKSQKADLRLDHEQDVLNHVVPGEPDDSELWLRISAVDEDERMPPVDSGLALSADEKHLIRQWIQQGARWKRHWSLDPLPESIDVPNVIDVDWPISDLDRFVLARLEAEGKKPSEQAPKWRWLRRVTFDLTGLPPTTQEIRNFENDDSAAAWEQVVDRLLASPRFGQHMAVSWLDAARYADSYGFQSDLLAPTWPWRDWLVGALNDNLPYDQFLIWQLAGDLLPVATSDQVLATAFNRLHRMTNEGGSLETEWRHENVVDRVNTLGTAILGMTLECARCHDHKFDPVSQKDYYNLFSFFNSIDEWGVYFESTRVPTPSLLLPDPEQKSAIEIAFTDYESAKSDVADFQRSFRSAGKPFDSAETNIPFGAAAVAWFSMDELEDNKWLANRIQPDQIGNTGGNTVLAPGRFGNAVRLTGDEACEFPNLETGLQPWERFAVSFWIYLPAKLSEGVILHHTDGQDIVFFGTELSLHSGKLRLAMQRFWPGNAIAIETSTAIPTEQWLHILASNNGEGSANGLQLLVDGVSDSSVLRDHLTKRPDPRGNGFSVGARYQSAGVPKALIDDLVVFERPLSSVEVRLILTDKESAPRDEFGTDELLEHELMNNFRFNYLQQRVAECYKMLLDAQTDVVEVSIMKETADAMPAWVLAGGSYDAPRNDDNRAERRTPETLPPMPETFEKNRLGLAQWLVTSNHPLTSRVAVNRLWKNFFGNGLVATTNDFGVQGQRPSNPELLDWLARDFIDSGWDVKRFCKQVVLGSTYRQESTVPAAVREHDPQNTMHGRGPERRLSAEMIRDQVLFAAGILDERIGGPAVSPYQPENLWTEGNSLTPAYKQSVGTDLYRRSLYTVWKRSSPMPNMVLFDAADREICSVGRAITNTPLQALVLLNDTQFVEAARVLAEKVLVGNDDQMDLVIKMMFAALTGRDPDQRELEILIETYQEQLPLFAANPDEARRLLEIGDHANESGLPPAQVAAITVVAQTIISCDASIWCR